MITVERNVGDHVRVAPYAYGERTGTDVQDRIATVVDHLQQHTGRARYFLRFLREDSYGRTDYFFDWVGGEQLRDY